jgi:glycopeptide antibiotics resistance protein
MNSHLGTHSIPKRIIANLELFLKVASVTLILVMTLFPYDFFFFEIGEQLSIQYVIEHGLENSSFIDALLNILLFIPFGLSIAFSKHRRWVADKAGFAILAQVTFFSFSLSLLIEFLQLFLPLRNPTPVDLITNSLGGMLGAGCFWLGRGKLYQFSAKTMLCLRIKFSRKMGILALMSYLCLIFLFTFWLNNLGSMWSLNNWDSRFSLAIGNEVTGDRPWTGQMTELCIANQALFEIEISQVFQEHCPSLVFKDRLVASYKLTNHYRVIENTGLSPDLVWQENRYENGPLELGLTHWLKSDFAATFLSQELSNSSQFTVSTVIATENTQQVGPVRIVSLANDTLNRNLALGQVGQHLSVRLRTPVTGKNGDRPELIVPNVFNDTKWHHLIMTYDGLFLKVYVDSLDRLKEIKLTPAAALFWSFSPPFSSRIHVSLLNSIFYHFAYLTLAFSPLGIFMRVIGWRKIYPAGWIICCGSIIVLSILLEATVWEKSAANAHGTGFISGIVSTALIAYFVSRR